MIHVIQADVLKSTGSQSLQGAAISEVGRQPCKGQGQFSFVKLKVDPREMESLKNLIAVFIIAELGINFQHIKDKTIQVLNPLKRADPHIMDDTDMAGPLVFCLAFGGLLLLVHK